MLISLCRRSGAKVHVLPQPRGRTVGREVLGRCVLVLGSYYRVAAERDVGAGKVMCEMVCVVTIWEV